MILRHSRDPIDGQPIENTFLAIDERSGELLGSSVIYVNKNSKLYPARPLQVRFQLEGASIPDSLLGATIARAKEICRLSNEFCRLYTHCTPDDDELLNALEALGFKDNDGLVKMELHLPTKHTAKAPAGCAVVYDTLNDPIEQKYFLERYNELFNTNRDIAWLNDFIDRKDFMRILTVAPTGMAGEVLIWRESYSGIIGYIQTSKRWRHLGVATYMLSLACEVFEQQNIYCAEANIRVRMPNLLKLMNAAGFEQTELLVRYPGIDVNPTD